jgi:hypothetical protein
MKDPNIHDTNRAGPKVAVYTWAAVLVLGVEANRHDIQNEVAGNVQ